MQPFACNECDLGRDEPGLQHCPDCGDITETYRTEPDDGQVWITRGSGEYLGVFVKADRDTLEGISATYTPEGIEPHEPGAFVEAVPHPVHGFAIVDLAA